MATIALLDNNHTKHPGLQRSGLLAGRLKMTEVPLKDLQLIFSGQLGNFSSKHFLQRLL